MPTASNAFCHGIDLAREKKWQGLNGKPRPTLWQGYGCKASPIEVQPGMHIDVCMHMHHARKEVEHAISDACSRARNLDVLSVLPCNLEKLYNHTC